MDRKTPFLAGPPVTGELFAGREKEISDLITFIEIKQPVALISPRRLGKTSLWENIDERLIEKKIIPVLIDCWSIGSKEELAKVMPDTIIESFRSITGKKLLKKRFNQLIQDRISTLIESIKTIGGSIGKIGEIFIEFREGSTDINEVLKEVLDFPEKFAKEQKIHLAIMLDEFQSLSEIDGQLLRLIRSTIQHHKNVSYIISGSQEGMMNYLTSNKNSPFYDMFEKIYVGTLPEKEVRDFIVRRFRKFGYEIDSEAINKIISFTELHPFYTQKLCLKCFLETRTSKNIDKQIVEESYRYMLSDLEDKFEDTLRGIIGVQKTILKTMAIYDLKTAKEISTYTVKESIQSINVAMRELTRKGFLKKIRRGNYDLVDPVLKDYIRRIFQ